MSELQTKRSVFMELKDGHPRVDRDKTLNERLPDFEMIRWLIEEKQSATFVMGFGAHAPIETPELATKFGLSTSEVETALRSTLVVFKDEAFDAIRLRGKRHGGPRNTNVSAEFVKLTMLKFLWLEPYLTDYDLTGRLADQGISVSYADLANYRDWMGLRRGSTSEELEAAKRRFAPCTWLREPLTKLLEAAEAEWAIDANATIAERTARPQRAVRRTGPKAPPPMMVTVGPNHPPPSGFRHIERPLFEHQRDALEKLDEWFATDEAGAMVSLPTGGGKTKTAVSFVLKNLMSAPAPRPRCLWLAHRDELMDQAYNAFVESAHESSHAFTVGQWTSTEKSRGQADVVVASIPTLTYRNNTNLQAFQAIQGNFDFVVMDECHHGPARTWRGLIAALREKKRLDDNKQLRVLGLSATPTRTAEHEIPYLNDLFGVVAYEISATELIRRQILSKPVLKPLETELTFTASAEERVRFEQFRELPSSLVDRIAENAERNAKIAETYLSKSAAWGPTLIFAATKNQGRALYKILEERKVRVGEVYGTTGSTDRARIVDDFKKRRLEVVINCGVFTEGTDLPGVESVFIARPTKSRILFAQMVGRGMRGTLAGGSEYCKIVSVVDDIVGLVQDTMTSCYSDEHDAAAALGLQPLDQSSSAAAAPEDEATKAEAIAANIQALRDLFQANGFVSDATLPVLPLLGWWEVSTPFESRFLPCFRPNERDEIGVWIRSLLGGERAFLELPTIPAVAFVYFERVMRRTGAFPPKWFDANHITPGTFDVVSKALEPIVSEEAIANVPAAEAPDAPELNIQTPEWYAYAIANRTTPEGAMILTDGTTIDAVSLAHAEVSWKKLREMVGPNPNDDIVNACITLATKPTTSHIAAEQIGKVLRQAIETGTFPKAKSKPPAATLLEILTFLRRTPKLEWRSIAACLVVAKICERPFSSDVELLRALTAAAISNHTKGVSP